MTTTETTIGINGMAHVVLTVSQFPSRDESAISRWKESVIPCGCMTGHLWG
jgi:hypothetical protein